MALGSDGSKVDVTFTANVQWTKESSLTGLSFWAYTSDEQYIELGQDVDGSNGWQLTYNVSLLPANTEWLVVKPIMASGCGVWKSFRLYVERNPFGYNHKIRDAKITWDQTRQRYDFSGIILENDILPITYPDPPPDLPLVGKLENTLNAGIAFEGSLSLSGEVIMRLVDPYAQAQIFSREVLDESVSFIDSGEEVRLNWCGSMPGYSRPICTPEWEDTSFILQGQLGTYDVHKQVFKSQVASFWGIVDVYASVSLGIRGGLQIDGVIKPMTPSEN